MQPFLSMLSIVALGYLAVCGLLFFAQRSQIYFPVPESTAPGAEALEIESAGVTLKVWALRREGSKALIYFGGNAENVALNLPGFSAALPEHSLYLVNYRGYGGSSGRPSEPGLRADALAVHGYIAQRHTHLDAMGRSLGAGVATYLASERPIERLVLVTAFDSMVKMAQHYYWWLPVGLLLRDRYESDRLAPKVTSPVLMVIAGNDDVVPRERSDALAAAFGPGQAEVVVVEGAAHNTLDYSGEYLGALRRFLHDF